MTIYFSNRISSTEVSLVDFTPVFTNSGSISLEKASVTSIGDRREVNILFSGYNTDALTTVTIPSYIFGKVASVHSTFNTTGSLENVGARINASFDRITIDRDDSIDTDAPLSITVVGKKYNGEVYDAVYDGLFSYDLGNVIASGVASGINPEFSATGSHTINVTTSSGVASFSGNNQPPEASAGSGVTLSNIWYDEFLSPTLDSEWHFRDPVGDVTMTHSGSNMVFDIPTGITHDIWTGRLNGPRLLRSTIDQNFEIGTKFNSIVDTRYQFQGLTAEQDTGNLIRVDFNHDGTNLRIIVATILNGVGSTNDVVNIVSSPNESPTYIKLKRTNDDWDTQIYNSGSWVTIGGGFTQAFTITGVGLQMGNHESTAPAIPQFTCIVDNFWGKNITTPIYALDGTVSDDGLPNPPGSLTTSWSKVSGPSTVTFDNSGSVDTNANFGDTGVYTLRLVADDSLATATGDITVSITGDNIPPFVDAGLDGSIVISGNHNLDGTVSDDGLPNSITTTWSKASGIGTATFGDSGLVDTTVSFDTTGFYTVRLSAYDGEITVTDDVYITVTG